MPDLVFCRNCGVRISAVAQICPQCGEPQPVPQAVPEIGDGLDRGFFGSIEICVKKYADFKGRAPRSEFWWWMLFQMLIGGALGTLVLPQLMQQIAANANHVPGTPPVLMNIPAMKFIWLYDIAVFLPNLAVQVRRLHDVNRTGWWAAAPFVVIPAVFVITLVTAVIIGVASSGGGVQPAPGAGLSSGNAIIIGIITLVISLLYLAWGITMLVWFCTRGTNGANRFGPNPLPAV